MRKRPRLSALVLAVLAMGGGTLHSATTSARIAPEPAYLPKPQGDLTVMTYNVKGLPWPVAWGRAAMLDAIGKRLARLRAHGRQPTVVVLQEAFTEDARRIADAAGIPTSSLVREARALWHRLEAPGIAARPWGRSLMAD